MSAFSNAPQKTKVIIVLIVATFVLITSLVIFLSIKNSKNQFGDEVKISNFNNLVSNLPSERRDAIFASLYKAVRLNSPEIKQEDINNAVIRESSVTQNTLNKGDEINGSFIVDIENIRQSYLISYIYADSAEKQVTVSGYSILVRCLDKEDIIYSEFNCKDIVSIKSGDLDPIIQYLPYSTLDYSIVARMYDSNTTLNVKLQLSESDLRGGESRAVEKYKSEVLDWIREKGFNPEDYTINFTY